MICSQCKKRTAVVFINKIENGVSSMEGLCKECAKKRGLDVPETNTNQSTSNQTNNNIDMNNMSKQLESLFKDLSSNLKLENLENMDFENFESDGDEDVDDENAPEGISMGIPIGSIFANFVPKKLKDEEETNGGRQKVKVESKKAKKKKKYLDTFGTNLTQKAKNNELDMVIGRDKEIQRVIQILNRRTKNNPCLIGEPGVGKTAIAQGLAIKIANNNVPAKLLNKEVYLLDMTSVIAGTQFRGQFEARMKGIIDECKEFKNIILVIDEIHNIIGAGDGEHSMNAANILKPSLANGEIQLIGTTTLREYRKYIEKDTALERRFQQVLVEEPNIDDTISILTGLKKYYVTDNYEVHALDGVSLSVEEGEFLAIIGTSGSGKTTLLQILGGLDEPTAGGVWIRGNSLKDMTEDERTIFRRRNIGFVFQQYNLIPVINVYENIVLPLRLDGAEIDEKLLEDIVRTLKIGEKLENLPEELSGGQQQRVAIARALMVKPAVLLCDEPTGNLDSVTSMEVISLLKTCAARFHQTVIVATHQEATAQMADRILRVEDGKLYNAEV